MNPIRIELPTEFNVGPVNSYLFTEPEPILVDCGVDTEAGWDALQGGLAQHGLMPTDIHRIIITHPHVDHFGLATHILAQSDCQVWVSDLAPEWLTNPKKMFGLRLAYYRDYFLRQAGLPKEASQLVQAYFAKVGEETTPIPAERIQTFKIEAWLAMGGADWQVLHMPGHASHQTCFYQPDSRQFLSADMLLPKTPTPIVERPSDGITRQPSLPIFMESLKRCEALEIDWVFPGHGEPFQNHCQLIHKQRNRIHKRKDEALTLIQQGHHTAYALMNEMYAHYPPAFRVAGLWMLIGYLDLLQAEGKIEVETVGSVWCFSVAGD
ncbi:MBL fold metallo-hydrolase [Candidatus Leptofilum sp.]|uniref:MBL fold metallo-hydrolase n=1 Tax=Candidatus Leptofilum sp. TaxID=3241576 RepID=UPI003B58E259